MLGVLLNLNIRHSTNDSRRLQFISNLNNTTFGFDNGLVTNKILPGVVTGLTVTFLNKRANLSWNAISGADHYIIEQESAIIHGFKLRQTLN